MSEQCDHVRYVDNGEPCFECADPGPFIDWAAFWERDRTTSEWLLEPLLARGRSHAIYAKTKQAKSLFTLASLVDLHGRVEDVTICYLDYEMAEEDVYERLVDMGCEGRNLKRLKYWLLPNLPPLDTEAGALNLNHAINRALAETDETNHPVVVIDTISRALSGDENDAATYSDYHSHTGLMLRRMGATVVRIDHAGKDVNRGQRGTSAKNADVDVVWRLELADDGQLVTLRRDQARMGWIPERQAFAIDEAPLRFRALAHPFSRAAKDVALLLDKLNVAPDASVNDALRALREAGEGRRKTLVSEAVTYRRKDAECPPNLPL